MNAAHCLAVVLFWANFMVCTLGARFGNQTSYQFCDENSAFGTPRGGRRTVPMRRPSPSILLLPSLTMRTPTAASPRVAKIHIFRPARTLFCSRLSYAYGALPLRTVSELNGGNDHGWSTESESHRGHTSRRLVFPRSPVGWLAAECADREARRADDTFQV